MTNEVMIKASEIIEICEDFLQEEIEEKGLQCVRAGNLKLIHSIIDLVEDAAEGFNPLKSNWKKPNDF